MSQITTHILDTAIGKPVAEVAVKLLHHADSQWALIGQGMTNQDGRVADLIDDQSLLPAGEYKLLFEVDNYFKKNGQQAFFSVVEVRFLIQSDRQHYHVPLLLSPFGYSTYRGS